MSSSESSAVVVVNPFSSGIVICHELIRRGYPVIAVWTSGILHCSFLAPHLPLTYEGQPLAFLAEIEERAEDTLETMSYRIREAATKSRTIAACMTGDEFGVEYADQLSEFMGLQSNGTHVPNRRNKKHQQELIKAAGLRSIRQAGGGTLMDVMDFLRAEEYPIVVKPNASAGTEGVKLCRTIQEAIEHFTNLKCMELQDGKECGEVLCQEFLRGAEYVVDHVSRNGRHVTTAIWVYDKRPANGSAFVYYGLKPVEMDSPEARVLIPYVRKVLDAMGIKHGPSHGEVMLSPEGEPCLVEMNCRAHGGTGSWRPLCNALTGGYSQIEATVYAYLEPEKFANLPDLPGRYLASGEEVVLVSYKSGKVTSTPGFDVIRRLQSFVSLKTPVQIGSVVSPSVDLETDCGSVILIHSNSTVLQRDIDLIRALESSHCLFEFEEHAPAWSETIPFGFDVIGSAARPQLSPCALLQRMSAAVDPRLRLLHAPSELCIRTASEMRSKERRKISARKKNDGFHRHERIKRQYSYLKMRRISEVGAAAINCK